MRDSNSGAMSAITHGLPNGTLPVSYTHLDVYKRQGLGHAMLCAPLPGRGAFPALKGTKERVGIFVTQQEGGFVQFNIAVSQIVVRQLAPGFFHEPLERDVRIGEAALQGAGARTEFPGCLLYTSWNDCG